MCGMAFDIRIDDADPGRIALAGELDLSAAPCLEEVVEQALADPRVAIVVLDMAQATFLDSSALGALVRGRRAATADGRRLVVVNTNGHVRRVLDITGVAESLTADGAGR
jgi:anti-sigma B factor antagonist